MENNGYEHEERLNGYSCGVFHCSDDGKKITLAGWTHNRRRFKAGDRILLHASKGQTTRYKITETKFPLDPTDQFFLYCEFDPRTPA